MKSILRKWSFVSTENKNKKRNTLNQSLTRKNVMDEIIDTNSEKAVNQAKVIGLQGKGRHGKGLIAPSSSQTLIFPYA